MKKAKTIIGVINFNNCHTANAIFNAWCQNVVSINNGLKQICHQQFIDRNISLSTSTLVHPVARQASSRTKMCFSKSHDYMAVFLVQADSASSLLCYFDLAIGTLCQGDQFFQQSGPQNKCNTSIQSIQPDLLSRLNRYLFIYLYFLSYYS